MNANWLLTKNNWIWGYIILIGLGMVISGIAYQFNANIDIELISIIHFWILALFYALPILVFSLFGISPLTPGKSAINSQEKIEFLVIIAAYNESLVISNSVKSMIKQATRHSSARVVVAFNGTDNTDEIARSLGAEVICTPTPGCGKSQAIAFALATIPPKNHRFVLILDADNLTDLDFLDQMSLAAQDGSIALQGNHQVLLASQNWVSRGLEAGYAASGRLFNPGRSRLLNSALLCGTGFAIREDIFRNLWGEIRTQTEDIELNGLLTLKYNAGVKWVQTANFYDEKPDTITIAIRQRVRWMVGHIKCMMIYSADLLSYSIKNRDIRALELSLYYTTPLLIFISSLWLLFIFPSSFILTLNISSIVPLHAINISIGLLIYAIGLPALGYMAINTENKPLKIVKAIYYAILSTLFALLVWPLSIVLAVLMLTRKDWMFHTPHRALSLKA